MTARPLAGRRAVITGGARGIGAAITRALAADGADVLACGRNEDALRELADSLEGAGVEVHTATCDVADPDSITMMATLAGEHLGHVDILVNNAGCAHSAPLHHQTLEDWNRLFAVNATGTFLCTKAFAPAMAQQGWGRVINIASVAARTGLRYVSAYSAAKHAVMGFTRSIAAEMADRGVTANAICPGYVDTDMTEQTLARIVEKTGMSRDEALASILQTTPQRRLITPEEVAHIAAMLCGENARGINGQAIGMDGGEFLG
ncbi:MAG: SDR family NAD(P)-dependent oxidoreductase [Acidobacteria bacterium]|nr:SDR family NAD(P)-dependent oxidoreductase [Acidobacteriota bacterium]